MNAHFPQHPSLAGLPFTLLDINTVSAATCYGVSTLYQKIAAGTFPPGILVGSSRRWRSDEIAQWLVAQVEQAAQLGKPPVPARIEKAVAARRVKKGASHAQA